MEIVKLLFNLAVVDRLVPPKGPLVVPGPHFVQPVD